VPANDCCYKYRICANSDGASATMVDKVLGKNGHQLDLIFGAGGSGGKVVCLSCRKGSQRKVCRVKL
jgi:hypothetical protein